MRYWTAVHSLFVLAAICAVIPLEAVAPPSESPADPSPLAGATPAPGSERFDPDEHPELAHLTEVTVASLAQGIASYVQAETARQGGVFTVNDPLQKTALGLTLVTVHRERLSRLADGRYFACADFKGHDGHTYDVDVFMRAESTGLRPTDVIVHKQDGKARFNWVEQNGTWSQAPVVTP
jgi:hypothetical protein